MLPDFDCRFLMTDMADSFWNGYLAAIPNGRARHLYCSWHVMKAVRQHVRAAYDGQGRERAERIICTFVSLCKTKSRSDFYKSLASLLTSLSDTEGGGVKAYLRRHYLTVLEKWAPFARLASSTNTSMAAEAYHRVLKQKYLEGSANLRLDHLVHVLIFMPSNMAKEQAKQVLIRLSTITGIL